MFDNETPPHDDIPEDDDILYDDDMVEVISDDNDAGILGDDEEDEDMPGEYEGPGLVGFEGQKPDHIIESGGTDPTDRAVFCCSFNNDGSLLITGNERDIADVWNCSSFDSPVFKCRGHKDSVVQVGFSYDSTYFSTCDMSGVVHVWKTSNYERITTFENSDLSWSLWHFGSNVLFAGFDDGSVYMWKIPTGDCKIYSGSNSKCEAGVLLPDGRRILCGYADGNFKLFDLKSGNTIHTFSKAFSSAVPILCVAAHPAKEVVACGRADGTVTCFNSQNGKMFSNFDICASTSTNASATQLAANSVEAVTFYADQTSDLVAFGTSGGVLVICDATTMNERCRLNLSGITKLQWHKPVPLLFAACTDGVVRLIDALAGNTLKLYGRHKTEILDIGLSKDSNKLVSASEDGSVFIFNLQ